MLIKCGNRIINDSYVVSYTYTPSKGYGETMLTIMLALTQGDGAQQTLMLKGNEAEELWEKLNEVIDGEGNRP